MWRTPCQDGVKTIVDSVEAQGVLPNKFMYVQNDGDGTYTVVDGIYQYLAFTELGKYFSNIPLVVGSFFQVNFSVLSKHVNYQFFVNVTYFDTFKIFGVINTEGYIYPFIPPKGYLNVLD